MYEYAMDVGGTPHGLLPTPTQTPKSFNNEDRYSTVL